MIVLLAILGVVFYYLLKFQASGDGLFSIGKWIKENSLDLIISAVSLIVLGLVGEEIVDFTGVPITKVSAFVGGYFVTDVIKNVIKVVASKTKK